MTDLPVTVLRFSQRRAPVAFYKGSARPTRGWRICHRLLSRSATCSLKRMKILKKSLPSEKLSTTLARLDRQNMSAEIR
ncbi:hypothetical protein GXB78_26760 [Pseudomonas moraviensis subsp. stanleyae]|uniref:hypothetical protein n=1 Tax=Pseudomonas moraviensis TaxID=321662 RepID=UPI002E2F25AE|nr:hypothetical protein [Pseudomonas moraviensis]MED7670808.1 hypothetical protein [Pseudomonas moraviensis subsp. stanleyae]